MKMLKRLIIAAGALLAAQLAVVQPSFADANMVDGEVTKVDPSAGKLTIKHGPIKNLDMDAMTMVFRVKEADMIKTVKAGDKIKFEADTVNGALTVTQIEAVK
jgi:Cu/Ag efflux protein CusF